MHDIGEIFQETVRYNAHEANKQKVYSEKCTELIKACQIYTSYGIICQKNKY